MLTAAPFAAAAEADQVTINVANITDFHGRLKYNPSTTTVKDAAGNPGALDQPLDGSRGGAQAEDLGGNGGLGLRAVLAVDPAVVMTRPAQGALDVLQRRHLGAGAGRGQFDGARRLQRLAQVVGRQDGREAAHPLGPAEGRRATRRDSARGGLAAVNAPGPALPRLRGI